MEGRPFAFPGAPPIPLDCRLKGIRVSRNHDSAPVLQTVAVKDSQRLPTSPSPSAGPVDPVPPCCTLYKGMDRASSPRPAAQKPAHDEPVTPHPN